MLVGDAELAELVLEKLAGGLGVLAERLFGLQRAEERLVGVAQG